MTTSNTIETTFKKYFSELKKEHKNRVNRFLKDTGNTYYSNNYLSKKDLKNPLSPSQKVALIKCNIIKANEKEYQKELTRLTFLMDAKDFTGCTINVEWKANRTWGSNPRAETFVSGIGYVKSGSIGGCGYDKQSTAVAKVLNQIQGLEKMMLLKAEKRGKKSLREFFGYGCGYNFKPYFEGNVGVSCYNTIFNKIGFEFKQTVNTKNFDVFTIQPKSKRK